MGETWKLVFVRDYQSEDYLFKKGEVAESGFESFKDAEDHNKIFYNDPDYDWDADIQICKVELDEDDRGTLIE